jgi:CRISPR-associated protein Csm5
MPEFLKQHTLKLTPLSPIHNRCRVDLEPTQFVIDNNTLYAFEPAQVMLNDLQRAELLKLAKQASIGGLQKFFKANNQAYRSDANEFIAVAPALAQEYEKKIGEVVQKEDNGGRVFNKFFLERTISNPISKQPYIPATSVKGALRTGMIDAKNNGQRLEPGLKSNNVEKFHIGEFDEGMSRFIKLSDFMPTDNQPIARQINYAVNRKKELKRDANGNEVQGKGISARKETICPAQYRGFSATVNIMDATHYPKWKSEFKAWVHACNQYHLPRWQQEMNVLIGRGFGSKTWCDTAEALIKQLHNQLTNGTVMLVRLGRYGGAESKVLSGNGVAQIKIMQGRGQTAQYLSSTKTVWLSAQKDNAQTEMFPFGWALIEIDPVNDNAAIQSWCATQSKNNPDPVALKNAVQADKAQRRAELEQVQAEKLQRQREQAEQEAKELAEQQARTAKLAQLSEAERAIQLYAEQLENAPMPKNPGGALFDNFRALIQQAQTWTDADKKLLVDTIRPISKKLYIGKAEKEFKAALKLLAGEH